MFINMTELSPRIRISRSILLPMFPLRLPKFSCGFGVVIWNLSWGFLGLNCVRLCSLINHHNQRAIEPDKDM